MRLKLFTQPTMAAAMAQVRNELGEDALILGTRRVGEGVEITAAIEDQPMAMTPPEVVMPDLNAAWGLEYHGTPPDLARILSSGPLSVTLPQHLSFRSLSLGIGDRPLVLAGPPGAGKTLTVARLATRLVLAGIKPMVITADGQRAGAAEQLAAFTRLLGLDLIVASQPQPLARALARREPGVPVLIDMPGSSPFDPVQTDEMDGILETADARLAVVLPAGFDPAEAQETAEAFMGFGAEYLIVTRLDISRRIGCVLAAAASGLALSEAGIGPGAADGLVPMTVDLLSRRIMEVPKKWERRQ